MSLVESQVATQEHADTVAKAALTKRTMEFITAEVEVQGDPKVKPGALVNIKKVGPYSGHYLVTEANHFYDAAGYSCIFYVARDKWGNSSNSAQQTQQARQQQRNVAQQQQQAVTPQVARSGTFIDLVLVDEGGAPVAGAKYEVTTSDGRTLQGSLDAQGRARVQGVGTGPCEVTFPDHAPDAWARG